MEDNFSTDGGGGRLCDDSSTLYLRHFVSIINTSAPPQIIRHQILEVGDP